MNTIDELTKAKEAAAQRATETKEAAESAAADVAESDAAVRVLEQRIAELTTTYEDSPADDEWQALTSARTSRDQHAARLSVRRGRAAKAAAAAALAAAELAEAERQVAYEHAREACEFSARHPEVIERATRVCQELAELGREFERLDDAARSHWRTYEAATGSHSTFGYRGGATSAARSAAQSVVRANLMAVAYALNGVVGHDTRRHLENVTPVGRW